MKKGTIVNELKPSLGNPRNSEGAFITTKDEGLLFIYSKFTGIDGDDNCKASLASIHSKDSGITWSNDTIILTPEEHTSMNLMCVSLIRMENDDIGLFYGCRFGEDDIRTYLRRSINEGKTWSSPSLCTQWKGCFVVENDRVIKLSNGRILIPAAYHIMKGGNPLVRDEHFYHRSLGVFFFYSDDDGQTWEEADNYCDIPSTITKTGLQEPGLIELANGSLWSWARTDLGCQYQMYSIDSGSSWTNAEPSIFKSPCSPMSMKRVPWSGSLFAVWNPVPTDGNPMWQNVDYWKVKRTPLVYAISEDEGKTWSNYQYIEDDTDLTFCYTAIHFLRDSLLLAYTVVGTEEDATVARLTARLRIKRIMLEDLE